jgi:orotidine-5'-phosphate decarboxylase
VAALERVIDAAADRGLMVVLDAKRGDIGISARHYAAATIGRQGIDAVTVSGYLGPDTLEPFVEVATEAGKGLFVLVRTSNPGSEAVQSQRLEDGRSVAEAMADLLVERGRSCIGESGYSAIGAVVGATHPADLLALRQRMARQVLLLPGYGAQGASADDTAPAFDDRGRGAIVTASRSVIYPFDPADRDWQAAIAAAAEGFAREVARVARG